MTEAPRYRKQEQEPASEAISEVAPGVLRAQLPIDMPGLGHVNCYLLEDERGVALVDPGLPGKDSYAALQSRLRQAGIPLSRVHTVVITHSHPDHFGGAGRLRHETGAEIVTDRRFRFFWDPSEPPDIDIEDATELSRRRMPWQPTPWGGPGHDMPWRRKVRFYAMRHVPRLLKLPHPTVRLADAESIRLARREWVAVHTPGHTEDHLCLFDPTEGVMLSGDHVLPTITPHIGGLIRHPDPLDQFFNSLDKAAAFGPEVNVALPAHGHPFTDLAARCDDIKVHHLDRLERLRQASIELGRPATVMEMSTHLFSPKAQGAMADSETYAHLEHLRRAGEAEHLDRDGVYEYVID